MLAFFSASTLINSPINGAEPAIAIVPEGPESKITVRGNSVTRWEEGEYEALLFEGACSLEQGDQRATGSRMLLLIDSGDPAQQLPMRVIAYFEDGVEVLFGPANAKQRLRDRTWLGRFYSFAPLDIHAPKFLGKPEVKPAMFDRMMTAHAAGDHLPKLGVQPTQYELPAPAATLPPPATALQPPLNPVPAQPPATIPQPAPVFPPGTGPPVVQPADSALRFQFGAQNVEIAPRGNGPGTRIQTFQHRQDVQETVVLATGGVTVIVRDVMLQPRPGEFMDLGVVTLSADRIVGWLPVFGGDRGLGEGDGELYLEGDIVFRQGDRTVYANRMYYNIRKSYGVVLQAEIITPIPDAAGIAGYARIKSEVVQQLSREEAVAYGAAVTTSRLGVPRYWLQTGEVRVRNTAGAAIDPLTGTAVPVERRPEITSRNNLVYLGGLPVFYWPTIATNLENPSFYLTGLSINRDRIFGEQVMLEWDMHQLLGLQNPTGNTEWKLSTDYLSERGFALGTQYTYNFSELFGLPGPITGGLDAWAIDDHGLDTLGIDRKDLQPEEDIRGRLLLHHRHYLPQDSELWADVGYVSDRNFLEQYLESEWDQDPDQTTGLRYRRYALNQMLDISGQVRVNDFSTQTNWLPKVDHYALGSSFFADHLTWSSHTHVGYAKLEPASTPQNAVEAAAFTLRPWEVDREGVRTATRQELAAPLELGPMKLVPFISGEAAYYGETINQEEVTRLLGQTGVRTTIPMWATFPGVSSQLLNINGLAHKVEWRGDFLYADADQNLDEFPLYDQIDDDSQEHFRRRFTTNTFGGAIPPQFDERAFAFRQGMQGWVTGPSTEIADDLMLGRLGVHQRLQTKRGLMGRERIVDLVEFDVDLLLFPKKDRDNFGETLGPATYDFKYHIGDRVSLLSDGYMDFFNDGLRSISGGVLWTRPGLGDLYLGALSLQGPISSTTIQASTNYRLDDKWIVNASTAFDLGNTGNIGQQLSLVRIGESLLLRMGVAVDSGRDNVSFQFGLEPRIWPKRRMGRLGGELIPPPGADGLE